LLHPTNANQSHPGHLKANISHTPEQIRYLSPHSLFLSHLSHSHTLSLFLCFFIVVFQSSCFYASFSCLISFSSLSLTHFLSLSVFLYRDFSLSLFLCLVFFFLPLSLISLTLFFLFLCFLLVFFSLAFSFFLLLALTFSVYLAPFFSHIFSHSFSLSLHLSFSFTNFVPLSPLSLSLLLSKFYLLLKHQDSI
jgi:hypothetical protein